MASADLRAELVCPICLDIYKDPVSLRCGHNFCQLCIGRVLDTQEGSREFSCPECREKFRHRSALRRNMKLRNIVETFLSAQRDQRQSGVFCTYCVDSPAAAVKSCLMCEARLCDKHLRLHSKSPEHVICDPTTSAQNRKCSIHNDTFRYYCIEDSACICMSCCLIEDHKGHQMESLDEASEKRKGNLQNVLQKMIIQKQEIEGKVQSFRKQMKKVQEQADEETKRATSLFTELRRRLEELEKRVLSDISGQKERISSSLSDQMKLLETKKDELSRKMRHIEELCNMADPLTVLQETDIGNLDGVKKHRGRGDGLLHDLNVFRISHTLHTGLSDIITWVNEGIYIPEPADISLDVNTAHDKLRLSDDRKTATWSGYSQNRPQTPERFQDIAQVISKQSFSSGRHYWDVDVGGSKSWRIGVCYPSIDRRGEHSRIGNNKSWVMGINFGVFFISKVFVHDNKETPLHTDTPTVRVRIFLNYEAGQISFYNLSNTVRHLHTFTTTFTEPLHAALLPTNGHIRILGREDHDRKGIHSEISYITYGC